LDKLVCDSRYQRGIEEKRVTRIIDNFDAKLLGTLELSKRKNGTFAVIDGQHRFEALKALGRKTCPALVHSDLSVQQEADLFARQNMGRKQLTPVQRFRAQVFSGDPQAVELQNAMTKYGFSAQVGPTTVNGAIRAIAALERIYRARGIENVEQTLSMIADLWYVEKVATDQHMIRGCSLFLWNYGDRFDEQHAERLRRVSALEILRRAKEKALAISNEAVVSIVADDVRRISGLRGTTGRKDQPVLSKQRSDELATV
jgi:hypothetical protein